MFLSIGYHGYGKVCSISILSSPRPLGAYDGSANLILTLPGDKKITDYTWISIWCRTAKVRFYLFPPPFIYALYKVFRANKVVWKS